MANDPQRFVAAIRKSGLTIYDPITVGDPALWIPTPDLQTLLDAGMHGMSVEGLPNRPRSKAVKERVCQVLGYPVPKSFRQTRPRFPGQMFDTYTQENNNLQVYNEGLDSTRRYVVMQISEAHEISRVKVVTGDVLRQLNLTGTLTRKYQARCNSRADRTELVTAKDTTLLAPFTNPQVDLRQVASPLKNPEAGQLLPIAGLFKRLSKLIGQSFEDAGFNQERKRGAALHGLICEALGYSSCQDDGQFPDVRHQLLRSSCKPRRRLIWVWFCRIAPTRFAVCPRLRASKSGTATCVMQSAAVTSKWGE